MDMDNCERQLQSGTFLSIALDIIVTGDKIVSSLDTYIDVSN
jgi:hypothetical protein